MNTSALAPRRPVLLVILDGFGANPSDTDNAIVAADGNLVRDLTADDLQMLLS